jgi:hypothetical protein
VGVITGVGARHSSRDRLWRKVVQGQGGASSPPGGVVAVAVVVVAVAVMVVGPPSPHARMPPMLTQAPRGVVRSAARGGRAFHGPWCSPAVHEQAWAWPKWAAVRITRW